MQGIIIPDDELDKHPPSFGCPKCGEVFDCREVNIHAVIVCGCGKKWEYKEGKWITTGLDKITW